MNKKWLTCGKIAVLVVDGNHSALCVLCCPLPALTAMQEAGVQLGQACWDVKQSTSGKFVWNLERLHLRDAYQDLKESSESSR